MILIKTSSKKIENIDYAKINTNSVKNLCFSLTGKFSGSNKLVRLYTSPKDFDLSELNELKKQKLINLVSESLIGTGQPNFQSNLLKVKKQIENKKSATKKNQ